MKNFFRLIVFLLAIYVFIAVMWAFLKIITTYTQTATAIVKDATCTKNSKGATTCKYTLEYNVNGRPYYGSCNNEPGFQTNQHILVKYNPSNPTDHICWT